MPAKRKVLVPVSNTLAHSLQKPKDDETVQFVQSLFDLSQDKKEVNQQLQESFQKITHMHEFLSVFRDHLAVQSALHMPEVLEQVAKKAKRGDVGAARLMYEVSTPLQMAMMQSQATTAIQINISPEQHAVLEADFLDLAADD